MYLLFFFYFSSLFANHLEKIIGKGKKSAFPKESVLSGSEARSSESHFFNDLDFWCIQNLRADLRSDYVQRVENSKISKEYSKRVNLRKGE